VATKHKLPVIQEDLADGPARPPYQWVGFGAVAIFVVWLPLAWLFGHLAGRVSATWLGPMSNAEEAAAAVSRLGAAERLRVSIALLALHGAGLVLASLAGGFLVGRWGGDAGVREAALSGGLAVAIVAGLSFATEGVSWTPIVALAVAMLASGAGGHMGRKRRPVR
jgi:tRNA-(ms[2]io[6]A)-hydroxylase